jgi:hypothetical protein
MELLSSWLLRVAAANLLVLSELLQGFESRYDRLLPSPIDHSLSEEAITALSKFLRVPAKRIRSLDLRQRAPHLQPGFLLRYEHDWRLDPHCTGRRVRYSYCRLCIREQSVLFARWDWSVAFLIRCAIHRVVLEEACQMCGDPDPLIFTTLESAPNTCCRSCGNDLTGGILETSHLATRRDIEVVENSYREALTGVIPCPALLGKTTDRAFRRFVEDLLQLLSHRFKPAWSSSSASFCRQDIVQMVNALILNAAPASDRAIAQKRRMHGLTLWTTLLSIIPQDEGPVLERASLHWPLTLRRRFASALHERRRKRWPFSPYSTWKELEKPVHRTAIAAVYSLNTKISTLQVRF